MSDTRRTRHAEQGFALILALLALVLLTTMGLALATSTSTEMQIATNYRWGLQARYNAEAGIELGKRYLRQVDWRAILPSARSTADLSSWGGVGDWSSIANISSRTGPEGEASRNFEMGGCDDWGYNAGLGVVLDDVNQAFPFQNSSTMLGASINGTFTLWIKRPMDVDGSGDRYDYEADDEVILTAEGTAPYSQGGATGSFQLTNRAVRYIQVTLKRIEPGDCENRSGQAGAGPGGANFDQCDAIQAEGVVGGATETAATAGID